ncbi:MAG: hypothetical protein Q7J51_00725 [Sheuella sp.]|nr:hypothetical protein [Sheuella sp.]
MSSFKTMLALSGVIVLGGCSPINSSSFRDMSSAYRDVLEGYANDNVLLNIVRASKRMPVSFLEMPSVVGTGNVSAGAGIGGTVYSAAPTTLGGFFSANNLAGTSYYSPNLSLSVNNGFNFTQSSMDNAAFMNSFLSNIKVETVAALTNNVVAPKEVLYSLVIDSIEVRNSKNEVVSLVENNPNLPNYAEDFQKALYTLIDAGLSTQQVVNKMVLSPPMDADTVNKQFGVLANAYSQPGFAIDVIKKPGSKDMYQAVRMVPEMQFCFNKQLSSALLGHVFSDSAYCANVGINTKEQLKKLEANSGPAVKDQAKVSLFIHLRSTRTVFDYLGTLVDLQHQNPARIISIKTIENPAMVGSKNASTPQYPIFEVAKNDRSRSISSVKYEGEIYSVPVDTRSWTRDVLVTLSQLLTLNKVPGSIPASPAVLIR